MSHVVIGGGLAGLSSAYYLSKQPFVNRIIVLESSPRLGGWIDTTRGSNGVLYEHGPRTIRPVGPQGANTLALAEELGLADRVRSIKYGHPSTVNRLVYTNGMLHKLPSSILSLFRHLPPFEKPLFMAGLKDLMNERGSAEDHSLYDFIARRFGQDVAQYAIDPMIRGICAGNARDISVNFIAKYLHQLEQRSGSVLKGYAVDLIKSKLTSNTDSNLEESSHLVEQARKEHWSVWGLENGLTTLVETLTDRLIKDGVEIYTNYSVDKLLFRKNTAIVNGESTITCDHVTLATPAFSAGQLLSGCASEVAKTLDDIPYVDVAVVNLEYKGQVLDMEAFGFLVPSNQPEPLLGCIFDTCSFKQGNRTLFTAMMGGAWADRVIDGKSQDEIEEIAIGTVSSILGIKSKPEKTITKVLKKCIAQYTVGHIARVEKARKLIESGGLPVSLVGSSYDGVGINDTIMSSRRGAELWASFQQ